jgi:hypothetical protein
MSTRAPNFENKTKCHKRVRTSPNLLCNVRLHTPIIHQPIGDPPTTSVTTGRMSWLPGSVFSLFEKGTWLFGRNTTMSLPPPSLLESPSLRWSSSFACRSQMGDCRSSGGGMMWFIKDVKGKLASDSRFQKRGISGLTRIPIRSVSLGRKYR